MHQQLWDMWDWLLSLILNFKMTLTGYLQSVHFSRQTRIILGVLAGLSVTVLLAGYFLSRRRRRYRAISTAELHRTATFRQSDYDSSHTGSPFHSWASTKRRHRTRRDVSSEDSSIISDHPPDRQLDHSLEPVTVHEEYVDYGSSDDSFHSTIEYMADQPLMGSLDEMHLYQSALDLVNQGSVTCRNIRTRMLQCHSDTDFLAKLHCVRLAFDELLSSSANREYFKQVGMDVMADFLRSANQDPTRFVESYVDLISFMESDSNWQVAKRELTVRKVACMNLYDIAMDFILLDAFDDLDHPPAAMSAVFQNRWLTSGMKHSALSAAIWSIMKAKKSLLKNKNGFMYRFYVLSGALVPTLAWGFLGTDEQLRRRCLHFRDTIMAFTCGIFSFESVRYTTVHTLSGDILKLAQRMAEAMTKTEID